MVESSRGKKPSKGVGRKRWEAVAYRLAGFYQNEANKWLENNQGKKVLPDDVRREILTRLEVSYKRKDEFFGVDWLNPDEQASFGDIPSRDVIEISDMLMSKGKEVTPENILAIYMSEL